MVLDEVGQVHGVGYNGHLVGCLIAVFTTGVLRTHVLLLVVLDEVGQVHGVGYNGHLVRRLVAVVEDAAVGTTE